MASRSLASTVARYLSTTTAHRHSELTNVLTCELDAASTAGTAVAGVLHPARPGGLS